MSDIVNFLEQKGTDHRGRTIQDIWTFDFFSLEGKHDFIQWLFPLDTPSKSTRYAPLLTQDDCEQIQQSEIAQQSLLKSFSVMLAFWGLKQENGEIIATEELNPKNLQHFWLRCANHNQLRMTRVIKSLAMLGQERLARKFQQSILTIAQNYNINQETITLWQKVLEKN